MQDVSWIQSSGAASYIELSYDSPAAAARQRLEDAALALQLGRARRIQRPSSDDVVLVGDHESLVRSVHDLRRGAREVLTVHQRVPTVAEFLPSHRLDRQMVRDGARLVGCFETRDMSEELLTFLAAAEEPVYCCCLGPVQTMVLDRELVLLDGPLRDGASTVLVTRSPQLVSEAVSYVQRVRAHAIPARDYRERLRSPRPEVDGHTLLTPRQRLIAGLLDSGATDAQIAVDLAISVRTVGSEVSRILETLGAGNRFAAGRRYAAVDAGQAR